MPTKRHWSSRFININDTRTHYLEAGEGERTVVMLHSGEFGASAELCWEHNIPAFAEHFRVIAPDWLGFGETDKIHDFVSKSDRMLRHLAAFVRVLEIESAYFVGASMGATRLLIEAAKPSPRLPIAGMVLVSGGGFVPDNSHRRKLLDYDASEAGMRAILRACLADPRWANDDAYVQRRVKESLRPGAWEAVTATRLKAPNVPARTQFGHADTIPYENVQVPTLAFAGALDQLREPGYHEALKRIPGARVEVFADAGHLLNIEAAESFNRIATAFLLGVW